MVVTKGARGIQPVKVEEVTEESLVSLLEADGDPFATLTAAAKATGLSESATRGLIRRLRAQYQPVVEELKNIHSGQLAKMLEEKAVLALSFIDGLNLSVASAKDCAIVAGILLEKRQLLRGEPTQIISTEERLGLDVLAQGITREAQRRGIVIDVESEEVQVLPPGMERATRTRAKKDIKGQVRLMEQTAKDEIGEPR